MMADGVKIIKQMAENDARRELGDLIQQAIDLLEGEGTWPRYTGVMVTHECYAQALSTLKEARGKCT